MSVLRQANLLGQQRLDAPHLRAVESSICADFDLLAGRMLAGQRPVVVTGFDLVSAGISKASDLQVHVANGAVIHYYATDSGSIYAAPATRANETLNSLNTRVRGAFMPNQTNYVGLDFVRVTLDTSRDLVSFLDANSRAETPKTVPVSRVLDYRIVISTIPFDSNKNVAPIAVVAVDVSGNISSVTDARNMMFSLASGGTVPNAKNFYTWPNGRTVGADKSLDSFKAWCDAVMSRIWELGGGEYWYSPTADRNVEVVYGPTPFASTGLPFEVVAGNLHWRGVKVVFSDSAGNVNTVSDQLVDSAGLTDLAAGECLFVDLDRSQNATISAQKGVLSSLGAGPVPGSRLVLAWRPVGGTAVYLRGLPNLTNSWMNTATLTVLGAVKCSASPYNGMPIAAVIADSGGFPTPDVFRQVIAGGVSRCSADFVGGAGDLVIGGGTNDQNIISILTGALYEFRLVKGSIMGGYNKIFSVGYDGSIGMSLASSTPATPGAGSEVTARLFLRSYQPADLVASNRHVDQVCVVWRDGRVTVIAESDSY